MSLALALWLIAAAAFVAYQVGHVRGWCEYARHVEDEPDPLLSLIKEVRRDEAELRRLCAKQAEAIERDREAARLN